MFNLTLQEELWGEDEELIAKSTCLKVVGVAKEEHELECLKSKDAEEPALKNKEENDGPLVVKDEI